MAIERLTLVDVNGTFLSSPGDELNIREPGGFDTFIRNIERSEYSGFNAEFGEGSSELGFSWVPKDGETQSSHEMLQAIIEADGVDGDVLLRYYRTDGGIETLDYEWTLLFSSSDEIDDTISFRVNRQDFGNKLRTRFDTSVDLESDEDLDEESNTALTLIELPLHPKKVKLIVDSNNISFRNLDVPVTNSTTSIITVNLGSPTISEIGGYSSPSDLVYGDVEIFDNVSPLISSSEYSGQMTISPNIPSVFYIDTLSSINYSITLSLYVDVYEGGILSNESLVSHNLLRQRSSASPPITTTQGFI